MVISSCPLHSHLVALHTVQSLLLKGPMRLTDLCWGYYSDVIFFGLFGFCTRKAKLSKSANFSASAFIGGGVKKQLKGT